jgi:hypothetical protein
MIERATLCGLSLRTSPSVPHDVFIFQPDVSAETLCLRAGSHAEMAYRARPWLSNQVFF